MCECSMTMTLLIITIHKQTLYLPHSAPVDSVKTTVKKPCSEKNHSGMIIRADMRLYYAHTHVARSKAGYILGHLRSAVHDLCTSSRHSERRLAGEESERRPPRAQRGSWRKRPDSDVDDAIHYAAPAIIKRTRIVMRVRVHITPITHN